MLRSKLKLLFSKRGYSQEIHHPHILVVSLTDQTYPPSHASFALNDYPHFTLQGLARALGGRLHIDSQGPKPKPVRDPSRPPRLSAKGGQPEPVPARPRQVVAPPRWLRFVDYGKHRLAGQAGLVDKHGTKWTLLQMPETQGTVFTPGDVMKDLMEEAKERRRREMADKEFREISMIHDDELLSRYPLHLLVLCNDPVTVCGGYHAWELFYPTPTRDAASPSLTSVRTAMLGVYAQYPKTLLLKWFVGANWLGVTKCPPERRAAFLEYVACDGGPQCLEYMVGYLAKKKIIPASNKK